jgi:two-component system, NarL family, response regulator NreC
MPAAPWEAAPAQPQSPAASEIAATVAAQAREELECLRASQRRPQERLAGDVGDVSVGVDGLAPGVDAEQLGVPGTRPVQPEQQANRGRLARAVRAEIAVDLAGADPEVELIEGPRASVALRQPGCVDRCLALIGLGAIRLGLTPLHLCHRVRICQSDVSGIRVFPGGWVTRVRALPPPIGVFTRWRVPSLRASVTNMATHLHLAPAADQHETKTAAAEQPIRVVLADDHAMMRRSLRLLMDGEDGVEVVAEADDLASVARHLQSHVPHVLVLDLRMPGGSTIEAIGQLRERAPDTQIVVMTMEENPVFAQRAFAAGALGFVAKDRADGELSKAVRAAGRGEEFVSPRVAVRLDALQRSLTDDALTPREVEVLRLIALGHTSVEIARKLHLSPRTVETHRANIHRKLELSTRAELVRYALRRGLVRA